MGNGSGSGNPELDRVLQIHKRRPKRFAALSWVIHVEFYDTEDEARSALAKVPARRRAAIVDRETGKTQTTKPLYPAVMGELRKRKLAPAHFKRIGPLGKLGKHRNPSRRRG